VIITLTTDRRPPRACPPDWRLRRQDHLLVRVPAEARRRRLSLGEAERQVGLREIPDDRLSGSRRCRELPLGVDVIDQ
jgi:hypothetical protein